MKTATPECDKALVVQEDSQKIGEFLDWLGEQDIQLCSPHKHSDNCYRCGTTELKEGERKSWDYLGQAKYTGEKEIDCSYHEGEEVYIHEPFEKLLARYFNIDLAKVEKEKQSILDKLRSHKYAKQAKNKKEGKA